MIEPLAFGRPTMKRRTLLGAALLAAAPFRGFAQTPAGAAAPSATVPAGAGATLARSPLVFEIWRNGDRIGTHRVDFEGGAQDFTAHIDAQMLVKFGPIPVFRYRHQAQETWRGGQFQQLQSHSTTNGSTLQLNADRTASGVSIVGKHALTAPADAHPLTHWNAAVLAGPLFNPQTGALVHDQVARAAGSSVKLADGRSVEATRYSLTGQAEITDWYDARNAWTALRAKAPDGSFIDYRRVA